MHLCQVVCVFIDYQMSSSIKQKLNLNAITRQRSVVNMVVSSQGLHGFVDYNSRVGVLGVGVDVNGGLLLAS